MDPYQPKWRVDRSRRPTSIKTNHATPVTWIATAGFSFIIIYAFVWPILAHAIRHSLGAGQ